MIAYRDRMKQLARALIGISHALSTVAVELIEHYGRMKDMTDAIGDLEGAQADSDSALSELATAVAAELDRVDTLVAHLRDEINQGGASADPARLVRVTQSVTAGNAKIRALVSQLNAESPADADAPAPDAPAASDANQATEPTEPAPAVQDGAAGGSGAAVDSAPSA